MREKPYIEFIESIEVDWNICSHCKTVFNFYNWKNCLNCWNSFDLTDKLDLDSTETIIAKDKISKIEWFDLWLCNSCWTINDNKPENCWNNNCDKISCTWCWNNFDKKNWTEPFWEFNDLTFWDKEWFDEEDFREKYWLAFDLSAKNKNEDIFISEYKKLKNKLKEKDLFSRKNEMQDLYNYLINYIKKYTYTESEKEIESSKENVKNILEHFNKKNASIWGVWTTIVLGMYFLLTPRFEDIKIDNHSWKISTPKEVFKYKEYEFFKDDNYQKRIYQEKKSDSRTKTVFLWNWEKFDWTYSIVNDWPKKQRIVPWSCYWTYKYVEKRVDDKSRPIKKEKKICIDKYKLITEVKKDCRTVRSWNKNKKICREIWNIYPR